MPDTLISLLQERADAHPEKTAFEYLRSSGEVGDYLSYGDLLLKAKAVAGYLQQRFEPGDRVLLVFPPGLECVVGLFGTFLAGMVAVPLAPPARRGLESIDLVAKDAEACAVLGNGTQLNRWRNAAGHESTVAGLDWVDTGKVEAVSAEAWRAPKTAPESWALLQYTSGSTREPRGVALTHRNILANSRLIQQRFGTGPRTLGVSWLPIHHDMGLIGNIIQPLYAGGGCILMAPTSFLQRPQLWLETISRRQATVSGGPSFAYEQCVTRIKETELAHLDLSSWEVAYCGAEPIRADTMKAFGTRFRSAGFRPEALLPCYGMAEATLMVTSAERLRPLEIVSFDTASLNAGTPTPAVPGAAATQLVGCGACDSGQRVVVMAEAGGAPLGECELGEIWVEGDGVSDGYYRRPQEHGRFHSRVAGEGGSWLRTGDLGFIHRNELFVVGRSDDQMVIHGRNLFAHDVEWALTDLHPGLGRSVAFAGQQSDQLVVVQELAARDAAEDLASIAAEIRRRVSSIVGIDLYALGIVASGSIPFTTSGKPQRSLCRQRYLGGNLPMVLHWQRAADSDMAPIQDVDTPPEEQIRAWLLERMAQRLQLEPDSVDPRAPFFDSGLTSLDAVELCAELEHWLQRPISPTIIYSRSSVSALSEWLARGRAPAEPASHHRVSAPPPTSDISSMSRAELEAWIAGQYNNDATTG